MYEEQRLIRIGFPVSEALGICHAMRKEGSLESFVEEQEALHFVDCKTQVDAILSGYGFIYTD